MNPQGLCPRCMREEIQELVPHYIRPKKFKRKGKNLVLFVCETCLEDIQSIIPTTRQLTDYEYLDITVRWLRGGTPRVL